ncbi:PREDICTED: octapeptide-repeat protein T2-like [Nicotiana attenuata]|uniref:octapeptide-repeat protein T2-like n=1 Tax=Nicotiana attenuata TaxID=49451 RepID=UPI000904A711|nr:PREDICTED: octapeptide-repeat protein T2-like [Nicotiana attenuata]
MLHLSRETKRTHPHIQRGERERERKREEGEDGARQDGSPENAKQEESPEIKGRRICSNSPGTRTSRLVVAPTRTEKDGRRKRLRRREGPEATEKKIRKKKEREREREGEREDGKREVNLPVTAPATVMATAKQQMP